MEGKVINLGDSNEIAQLMNKMHMQSMINNQAPVLAPTVTDTKLLNNSVEPGDDIDDIYSDNTPISLKNPISLENLPHTSGDPTATITVAAPNPIILPNSIQAPIKPWWYQIKQWQIKQG